MTTILGIDPSLTSTGLVVLSGSGETLHHEAVKTEPIRTEVDNGALTRFRAISGRILKTCGRYGPSVIVMEGLVVSVRGPSMIQMAGLHWHLRDRLAQEYPPVGGRMWLVSPAKLKQAVECKGNAGKDEVQAAVKRIYGVEFPSHDETDAYVLARIGLKG